MKTYIKIFKRFIVLFFCVIGFAFNSHAQEDSVIDELQKTLDSSLIYDQAKLNHIKTITAQHLMIDSENLNASFDVYNMENLV